MVENDVRVSKCIKNMNYKSKLNELLVTYQHAKRSVDEEQKLLDRSESHLRSAEVSQKLVQEVAESVQKVAHKQIATIVTRCLKAVFGEDAYTFEISFEQKRGKTEARLVFVRDGNEVDPTFASGGGVLDVAAFALRLACLVLSRPSKRKLLVLDEPAKFLSRNYRGEFKELLEQLSEELDIQIIMITHAEEFVTGKVIELT